MQFMQKIILAIERKNLVFGDLHPTENAWRRKSNIPFSLVIAWILNLPTKIIGLGLDRLRT